MSTTSNQPTVSTDEELQDWLDSLPPIEPVKYRKLPSWEEIQFNFKRELYRKAIGAN